MHESILLDSQECARFHVILILIKFGKYGTCHSCSEMQRVNLAAGVTGELLEFSQPNVYCLTVHKY